MSGITLRSYKLTHDTGFAPNPFFGSLTLATCKPGIRRTAKIGDWIAGFTSGGLCGDPVGQERLVYLMKVTERLTLAEYFCDSRFVVKRAIGCAGSEIGRRGDNIYRPLRPEAKEAAEFEQRPNPHHWNRNGNCEDAASKRRDIGGRNVLIASDYVYFGRNALVIPAALRPDVPVGQAGYGSLTHDSHRVRDFIDFVYAGKDQKMMGPPHVWPSGDETWRQ